MELSLACAMCGKDIAGTKRGRPAKYCGNACRQRAFRQRSRPEEPEQQPGTGLPEVLDEFVGRVSELRRLRSLRRSARLLTLVGPGGAGKTRLALRLAAGVRGGGARLVELDSIGPHDLIPHVVAALGIRERHGEPLLDTLVSTLRASGLWLVLDNCEHVVDKCAYLVDTLLRRCPGLRILATSREALRVPGEVVYRVGALTLPEPGAEHDLASLQRSDAIQLFVARARASSPEFALTGENAGAIAELCRWLDGLPLAIELAARRAGQLPLARISAWLTEHPTLLAGGSRTGPIRHRDLRATLEWSYRLLDSDEKALFRRLSVYPGGFDLDAAVAVSEDPDVARLVYALEAKSLIERTAEPDVVRFRQLNAVRGFGLERLAEAGESGPARARAISWLAGLAETMVRKGADDFVTRRLHQERENLAAAVERTSPGSDQFVLVAIGLAQVWYRLGQLTRCRTLLAEALHCAPGSAYRGFVLSQAARAACVQGALAEGTEFAVEAVRLGRADESDAVALCSALDALGFSLLCRTKFVDSVAVYRECVAVSMRTGRVEDVAIHRHNLAWALLSAGEAEEAAEVLAECLPVLRSSGSPWRQAAVLHTYGAIQLAKRDFAGAGTTFAEVLRNASTDSRAMAYAVEGLGLAERGDPRRVLRLLGAAGELRRRIGLPAESQWRRQVELAVAGAEEAVGPADAGALLAAGRSIPAARLPSFATAEHGRTDPLSMREFEVAKLVAEGLTNRQIALDLHVSAGTVAAHLDRIRDKIGLRSRTQIALWFVARASP